MSGLVAGSLELLQRMYSHEHGLFSATASLEGGRVVNDFEPASHAIRYTVNNLAALQVARTAGETAWDVDEALDRFLALHGSQVTNPGDRGLLRLVLAEAGRLDDLPGGRDPAGLEPATLQESCWTLLGLMRQAERGDESAAEPARQMWSRIQRGLWDAETRFPYQAAHGPRRRFVSFGGITYFLQATAEYARVMDDDRAREIFAELLERILALQGPRGEWGWFYDAQRGRLVEWYEVFTVHQLAMAPLFLLPAHDLGLPGADEAIRRGYRWAFGENELGVPMAFEDPFFTHRAIRRRSEGGRGRGRGRRVARAIGRTVAGTEAKPVPPRSLDVNPECRSYEIGWIVYAWAGRRDFGELTDLALLGEQRMPGGKAV